MGAAEGLTHGASPHAQPRPGWGPRGSQLRPGPSTPARAEARGHAGQKQSGECGSAGPPGVGGCPAGPAPPPGPGLDARGLVVPQPSGHRHLLGPCSLRCPGREGLGGRERSLGSCPGLSPCPTPRPPAQPRSPYCCGDKLLPQAATAISLRPAPQPSPTLPSRAAPPPRGWEPGRAWAPRWVLVPGTWLEGPAWRTSGEARGRPAPQQ